MPRSLRFVIVPKVAHPWFDEVHEGALAQAGILGREIGGRVVVEYRPPASCDPGAQDAVLAETAAGRPDGIALDPVDTVERLAAVRLVRDRGIPLVLFDSPSPDGSLTSIGSSFTRQGGIAAERLVGLLGHAGKVAVMQGVPTAPNHRERFAAQLDVLRRHPGITVVDGGIDNDDIETARQQAASVLEAHPDLAGYLCCDASGPIGIAAAIEQAGRTGTVRVVGMDGIEPILDAIRAGIIESSAAGVPRLQGAMSILMLWQASLGAPLPRAVDTGIDLITRETLERDAGSASRASTKTGAG